MNKKTMKLLLEIQRDEAESLKIYTKLARKQKNKKNKKLPPGLAKKEKLPPGLAKQLEKNGSLPPDFLRQLSITPYAISQNTSIRHPARRGEAEVVAKRHI